MRLSFKLAIPGFLTIAFAMAHTGCAGSKQQSPSAAAAELPAPVRATLDRETAGGTVRESEREVKKGRVVYAFGADVAGEKWDIEIAEDGTLLSKEIER